MARKIAPKPTVYQGVEFRSRLEARWAVFFDAAGIKWNYEPRWIQLESGPYLPDFILPELHLVVEVKPVFNGPAIDRLDEAVNVLNEDSNVDWEGVLLTQGNLSVPSLIDKDGPVKVIGIECPIPGFVWCECPICGRVALGNLGLPWLNCDEHARWDDRRTTEATPKLRGSYQKAIRAFTRVR